MASRLFIKKRSSVQKAPRMFSIASRPCIVSLLPNSILVHDPQSFEFQRIFIVCEVRGHPSTGWLIEGPMSALDCLNCDFHCSPSVPHFDVELGQGCSWVVGVLSFFHFRAQFFNRDSIELFASLVLTIVEKTALGKTQMAKISTFPWTIIPCCDSK